MKPFHKPLKNSTDGVQGHSPWDGECRHCEPKARQSHRLFFICLLTLLIGTAAAQSTPETFPPDYLPEDFTIPTSDDSLSERSELRESPTRRSSKRSASEGGPTTFSINQLKREAATPSGTTPIALPPTENTAPISSSLRNGAPIMRPLSAVFPAANSTAPAASNTLAPSTLAPSQTIEQLGTFGPLNPKNGGFTAQVWQASNPPPTFIPTHSPALREALRRLLLTSHDSLSEHSELSESATRRSSERSASEGGQKTYIGWFLFRTQTLQTLGLSEAAHSLWQTVPQNLRTEYPALAQGWAESTLLAGESTQPCATARSLLAANQLPQFQRANWQAIVATCTALEVQQGLSAAQNAGADAATRAQANSALGLSLQFLPPELATQNPTLVEALTALQNGQTYNLGSNCESNDAMRDAERHCEPKARQSPVVLPRASTLAGAILATYPALINPQTLPQTLATLPDVALRRLRQTTTLPLALRTQAAQALVAQTGWLPDGLALAQLASNSQPSPQTAPAATLAWAGQGAALQLLKSSPTELTPTLAHTVITAALLMGDTPTAAKWSKILNQKDGVEGQSPSDGVSPSLRAEGAAISLNSRQPQFQHLHLALKIAQNQPITLDEWQNWLTPQTLGTPVVAQHAQRTLLVAEAMGQSIPLPIWQIYQQRTLGLPSANNPAWQRLLASAAQQQNIPQTLALIAEALQTKPANQAAPEVAAASTKALHAIGLPQLALRFAMESTLSPALENSDDSLSEHSEVSESPTRRSSKRSESEGGPQPTPNPSQTYPKPIPNHPTNHPKPNPKQPSNYPKKYQKHAASTAHQLNP